MSTLLRGLVGSFRLTCVVEGCGQEIELDHPSVPPGWCESDEGVICPRHRVVVIAVDPPVEEVYELALAEASARDAAALGAMKRAEREAEAAAQEAARRARVSEAQAREDAQTIREREAQDTLRRKGPEGEAWAKKRAGLVLNRTGWDASTDEIGAEAERRWPGLATDLVALIVEAALKLQAEQEGRRP